MSSHTSVQTLRNGAAHRARPVRFVLRAALLATLLLAAGSAGADTEIRSEDQYPLRGEGTRLTVTVDDAPAAGVVIEAQYRPNSETSSSETLPPTGADGTVLWTPRDAGIVTLTAQSGESVAAPATLQVAVRFGAFPLQGFGIMILAGVLLFGGAGLGFSRLLRGDAVPPEEPPST